MDTLVALGSTTAYSYSAWVLLSGQHGHLYFMEAAAIITLISLGHYVEARVSARASDAVARVAELGAGHARRLSPDGTETTVPLPELRLQDRAVVKPGDRIPTDGESRGRRIGPWMNRCSRGESLPVDKSRRNWCMRERSI